METIKIMWNKTKKNVENVITKYIYYSLSVDNNSTSDISDNYVLDKLVNDKSSSYTNISNEEKNKRIEFINYVRFSFNKLTSE